MAGWLLLIHRNMDDTLLVGGGSKMREDPASGNVMGT